MKFFSRENKKIIVIIAIAVLTIFIFSRGAQNPIKGTVLRATGPFLKTFRLFSGGIAGFFDFLGSIGDLKEENQKLIKENQERLAETVRFKDIEKENEKLREELKLLPREKYDLEGCFIIAQDPKSPGSRFIIDKGENKGLKKGMPIVVSKSILVGKISEVFSGESEISLLADPSSAINAEILESGAKGILKGEYGIGLKIEMISQSDIVQEGDTVITSGLGSETPRGLYIGKIIQVSQSEDKLFQQAAVVPAADLNNLSVVFAVKN